MNMKIRLKDFASIAWHKCAAHQAAITPLSFLSSFSHSTSPHHRHSDGPVSEFVITEYFRRQTDAERCRQTPMLPAVPRIHCHIADG